MGAASINAAGSARPQSDFGGVSLSGTASEEQIPVMLDSVRYTTKPDAYVPAITDRLKAAGPCLCTPFELAQAIADGRTICPACFAPDPSATFGHSAFMGQRVFALDFDNTGEHRAPLMPSDPLYLDPWEAVARFAKTFGRDPLMVYPSMSCRPPRTMADRWRAETRAKYRIVLDAGEIVTDADRATEIQAKLLKVFPEADQSTKNLNRLYFGSNGRVALNWGGVTHYVKRS